MFLIDFLKINNINLSHREKFSKNKRFNQFMTKRRKKDAMGTNVRLTWHIDDLARFEEEFNRKIIKVPRKNAEWTKNKQQGNTWTQSAIDCYERNCICEGCICSDLASGCVMKLKIPKIIELYGLPEKVSIGEVGAYL